MRSKCFQSDLSFLLGASFADPNRSAVLKDGRVFIEDKLDHLAAPEVETSAEPKTFFRGIKDETREPLLLAAQIDDQAGGLPRHQPPRAPALGDRKAGHSSSQVCPAGPTLNPTTNGLASRGAYFQLHFQLNAKLRLTPRLCRIEQRIKVEEALRPVKNDR